MSLANEAFYSVATAAAKCLHNLRAPARQAEVRSFGPDPNQKFIVYSPEKVLHPEIVFYFHGGGYFIGRPESMAIAADCFGAQGYRLVSVGFRHMPRFPFPAQIEDVFTGSAAALACLEKEGIPAGRIIPAGNSAGGHAAAMLALDRKRCLRYGIDPARIAALISVAGALSAEAFGCTKGDRAGASRCIRLPPDESMADYSPIDLICPDTVIPALCINGAWDRIIPPSTASAFVERLNSAARGISDSAPPPGELLILPERKYQHIRLTAGLFAEDYAASKIQRAIFDFLARHEGGSQH